MLFTSDVKEALNHKFSDMADELKKQGKEIVSLCVGEPDLRTPDYVVEAMCEALRSGNTRYCNAQGLLELREAIAKDVSNNHRCSYSAKEVMIAPGTKPASFFALCSILEPDDEVIIISPYYVSYPTEVALAEPSACIKYVSLKDDLSLDIDKLKEAISTKTKCIMVNSPNNPTGSMLTKKEIEVIATLAIEYDFYILADEIYEKLVYSGEVFHSFLDVEGIKEKLIVVNGFAKSHAMTGYRLGYALANEVVVKKMKLFAQQTITNTSTPIQAGALEIYKHDWNEHLLPYIASLEERMTFFHNELNKLSYFSGRLPRTSFYYWADISKSGLDSMTFCERMIKEVGVVATPGLAFGKEWNNYVRFSIAMPKEDLERAIELMRDFRV